MSLQTSYVILRSRCWRGIKANKDLVIHGVYANPTDDWSIMMMVDDIKLTPDFYPANIIIGSATVNHKLASPLFVEKRKTFKIKIRHDNKEEKRIVLGVDIEAALPSQQCE